MAAVNDEVPDTPGWWLTQLRTRLADKQATFEKLDLYARGEPPNVETTDTVRDSYKKFQQRARTNFAGLVVESVLNRTTVTGFTSGDSQDADEQAWDVWQANNLDAEAPIAHRASYVMGEASIIVGAPDPDTLEPVITIEDPRQVITVMDPVRRRRTRVAYKEFTDEWTGEQHAYLYLPGAVWRASYSAENDEWGWVETIGLPFLQVPVVWMPNRLDVDGRRTLGEFQDATDVIDRIATGILNRLVITAMQAFRQRVLKGLPKYDETGEVIDYEGQFAADPAALWMVPEGVEVWESNAADINGILTAVRHDVQDLAAVTRTPIAWLMPESANQSAEGAQFAREGLTARVQDRCRSFSESWEQVMALAFMWKGDAARGNPMAWETLWSPAAEPSLAQRYDAAVKGQQAGVPWRYLMTEVIGMTPPELKAAETERDEEAATREPAAPAGVLPAEV